MPSVLFAYLQVSSTSTSESVKLLGWGQSPLRCMERTIQLHLFLSTELDEGEGSASSSGHFTAGKEPVYRRHVLTSDGFEPRLFQPVPWAIPVAPSRFLVWLAMILHHNLPCWNNENTTPCNQDVSCRNSVSLQILGKSVPASHSSSLTFRLYV